MDAEKLLASAVNKIRDIAAMGRKAGSESARNWLFQHGYAEEPGGYVPGVGFEDSAPALARRSAE